MVECNLAKVKVAGSNPVSRSSHLNNRAALAALFRKRSQGTASALLSGT